MGTMCPDCGDIWPRWPDSADQYGLFVDALLRIYHCSKCGACVREAAQCFAENLSSEALQRLLRSRALYAS